MAVVLCRKTNESVTLRYRNERGELEKIEVVMGKIKKAGTRLIVKAPSDVKILRSELELVE